MFIVDTQLPVLSEINLLLHLFTRIFCLTR